MPVNGHFEGRVQGCGRRWLGEEPVRMGGLGAFERHAIGVRRQEDHGNMMPRPDLLCGCDAIARAFDADVHQDYIGGGGLGHGVGGIGARRHHRVSQRFQALDDILGDQSFIFNHQYFAGALGHVHLHRYRIWWGHGGVFLQRIAC
jgi:hypothetical protein